MSQPIQSHHSRSASLYWFASVLLAAVALPATAQTPDAQPAPAPSSAQPRLAESFGKLPLAFEPNRGQVGEPVRFLSRGNGYGLYLTSREAVLALRTPAAAVSGTPRLETYGVTPAQLRSPLPGQSGLATQARRASSFDLLRMQLAGANPNVEPTGVDVLPGVANYFLGNDPARWHSDIPTFSRVRYPCIYPGVDLIYYGNQGRLEYDFVVAPGANPSPIRLRFAGAHGLRINPAGDLAVSTAHGAIAFQKPTIYQLIDGRRQTVEGSFRLVARNSVGFALGTYDHSRPLVIDPTLIYSTFLGGSQGEYIVSVATDASGNAYVTGLTISLDFPTTAGAFQSVNFATAGNEVSTAFVSKINPSGTALLYSTFLGGNAIANTLHLQGDYGHAIAVDSSGNAYVTGWTYSSNFPVTAGAFQTGSRTATIGNATGFVTKLNPAGTHLVYSTYLGGSLLDEPTWIAIDSAGDAFIGGLSFSGDFPTTSGAYQATNRSAHINGFNTFVTKLNPQGTSLVYSTYLGGSQDKGAELGTSYWTNPVAVDTNGNAYIEGFSQSSDFPVTSGAFQTFNKAAGNGGSEITVSKLNPSGTGLVYSTLLGGTTDSFSEGLAIDSTGNAYVAGFTSDLDFPVTKGAFQTTNRAASTSGNTGSSTTNGFVSKLNPTGTALVYSSYLGGTTGPWGGDGILALAVDGSGDAYVTGYVMSDDFPVTADALQSTNHGATHCCDYFTYATNTFVTEFNPGGTALLYSSYFGGSGVQNTQGPGAFGDSAYGVALGSGGYVYSVGAASSADFPTTPKAFETTYHSTQNMGYIARFDLHAPPATIETATTLTPSANSVPPGTSVTFTASVAPVSGSAVPTGNIVFSMDEAKVATVALNTAGSATWSSAPLVAGAHYVLATYSGSTTYAGSADGFNEIAAPLAPVITPAGGAYMSQQKVTITSPTKTGVLYYTLDGSAPSRFSTPYTGPLTINYTTTVNAVAVAENDANSTVSTAAYNLTDSPWVLAAPATAVSTPSATLNAFVSPRGLTGSYYFQYGTSSTALTTHTATTNLAASAVPALTTTRLTSLKTKTTYYFNVVVTTAAGTTSGEVLSFTTN